MNAVTKEQASTITAAIQEAVNTVLANHGMEAVKVTTNYGDLYAFKVEASPTIASKNGVNLSTPNARLWVQVGYMHGFANPDAVLGEPVVRDGKTFYFAGVKNAPKNFTCWKDAAGMWYAAPQSWLTKLPNYDAKLDSYASTN